MSISEVTGQNTKSLFKLRPWKESDLSSLVKYANNPEIAKNLTDKFPYPYTEENGKAFIAFANAGNPVHVFAIEINGEAAGGIGIHPQEDVFRKNAELGYWLAEPFWGKGIITDAIRQITEYGFRTFDITRIFARPYGTNLASQKVLQKAGFTLEGKFSKTLFKNGEFQDEFIYAIRSGS
jgi:[ribosomal protein S5]-alanine N-acetyltransferase